MIDNQDKFIELMLHLTLCKVRTPKKSPINGVPYTLLVQSSPYCQRTDKTKATKARRMPRTTPHPKSANIPSLSFI